MSEETEQTKTIPSFPVRFIGAIMDNGFDALHEYLKANESPEAIIQLAEGLDLLEAYIEHCARNSGDHDQGERATMGLAYITNALDRLSFSFHSTRGIA